MKVWLGLLLLWPVWVAAADTVIVKDVLPINVRSGPGTSFPIIAAVKSGQRLTVLDDKPGYYMVRTPKNNQGWVLARFVQTEPVAQEKLDAMAAQHDRAIAKQQTAEKSLKQLQQRYDALATRYERLLKSGAAQPDPAAVDKAAEPAASPAPAAETLSCDEAPGASVQPPAATGDSVARPNMLLGAGILLAGILLGLIIPLLRYRKRAPS